jgi:Tol biopolymer transport system component
VISADASGNISWSFTSSCSTKIDTYSIYALDSTTQTKSNNVTEIVTQGHCPALPFTQITETFYGIPAPVINADGSKIAFVMTATDNLGVNRLFSANSDGTGLLEISPPGLSVSTNFGTNAIAIGSNKIAFVGCPSRCGVGFDNVYVINADGTGLTQLSFEGHIRSLPAISGDGSTVVFTSFPNYWLHGDQTFIVKSDGTGLRELTLPNYNASLVPSLSYNGSIIAYLWYDRTTFKIATMNMDDTDWQIAHDVGSLGTNFDFRMSGDGNRIVFTRSYGVFAVNSDGSNFRTLVPEGEFAWADSPSITSDGARICYSKTLPGSTSDVFTMDMDGNNKQNITNTPTGTDYRGYPLVSGLSAMSADGSKIVFVSSADLDPGKNPGHTFQVFVASTAH